MSLLACPSVEFLDEPTTGVDPVSRRSLFKMLKHLEDCSLVLTTHRMEEAEQLCDNICIMINGRFVVYGSPGHLKSEYGLGYSISLLARGEATEMKAYVTSKMPYLEYKDSVVSKDSLIGEEPVTEYMYQMTSNLLTKESSLSSIFKHLCSMKIDSKIITDFKVTRSSLEQVFVSFAKHQI